MDFNSDERMVDLKHRPRTRCCSLKSGTTSTRNRSTISYHHPVCLYMLGRWVIQTSFHSFSFSSFPCSGGGGGGEGGGGGYNAQYVNKYNALECNGRWVLC